MVRTERREDAPHRHAFETDFAGDATAVAGEHRLELKPGVVKPGQTVLLRAVAWDRPTHR